MAGLTCSAGTTSGHAGAMGSSEDHKVGDLLKKVPTMKIPLNVNQDVIIWYFRDRSCYKGIIVFKRLESYEVEFRYNGGPRLRTWFEPSRDFIRPDTLEIRELLETHGFDLS